MTGHAGFGAAKSASAPAFFGRDFMKFDPRHRGGATLGFFKGWKQQRYRTMTAEELLSWWCRKAVLNDDAELSRLDALVFDVVSDARRKGIPRSILDKAAGGSVRKYFRSAILDHKRNIKPELADVLIDHDPE